MTDMAMVFLVLGLTIVMFLWGRLPSDLVAILSLLGLFFAGVVSPVEALAGFSNSTVILVGALFVVGEGLTRTGVTAYAGERLVAASGGNFVRLLVVMMLATAVLSAFISNTGTVATLMPAVIIAAWGVGSSPSRFLIPMAFAASVGGVLTLTGTPPNVVVAEALESHGYRPFDYFEYSLIGVPLLVTTIVYMIAVGQRLLPSRETGTAPRPLGHMLEGLVETYALDGEIYRLHVLPGSPLVGTTLRESPLVSSPGIAVLQIASLSRPESGRRGPLLEPLRAAVAKLRSQPQSIVRQEHRFEVDDVLTVRASAADIHRAEVDWRLGVLPLEGGEGQLSQLLSSELGVAEVLLTPRSRYIGEVIGDDWLVGEARVAVLGVRRGTTQLSPNAELQFGDSILINGMWETIGDLQDAQDDLIVVGCPEEIASQVTGLSTQSGVALAILIGMVGLMVSGEVPVAIAALVAAGAMVLFGCLTTQEAYGAVSWSTVILIAGMLPMATALENTGGAKHMADILVETLGGIGHVAVLAGIFVVTTTLSQVMSNTATAVLMSPIVITAAESLGVSPHPLMMGLAVAASTAFLTPIGTTTNLLVLSPGNYRFSDYGKVGAPLVAIFLLISLVLIPIFWPF